MRSRPFSYPFGFFPILKFSLLHLHLPLLHPLHPLLLHPGEGRGEGGGHGGEVLLHPQLLQQLSVLGEQVKLAPLALELHQQVQRMRVRAEKGRQFVEGGEGIEKGVGQGRGVEGGDGGGGGEVERVVDVKIHRGVRSLLERRRGGLRFDGRGDWRGFSPQGVQGGKAVGG